MAERTDTASLLRPRGPGLQAERTALAWTRTGMGLLVIVLPVWRLGWTNGAVRPSVSAIALLLSAAGVIAFGIRRTALMQSGTAALPTQAVWCVAGITMMCCCAALTAMWARHLVWQG